MFFTPFLVGNIVCVSGSNSRSQGGCVAWVDTAFSRVLCHLLFQQCIWLIPHPCQNLVVCLFILANLVGVQRQLMDVLHIFLMTNEVRGLFVCYSLHYDHVNSHIIVCSRMYSLRLVPVFVIISDATISIFGLLWEFCCGQILMHHVRLLSEMLVPLCGWQYRRAL